MLYSIHADTKLSKRAIEGALRPQLRQPEEGHRDLEHGIRLVPCFAVKGCVITLIVGIADVLAVHLRGV